MKGTGIIRMWPPPRMPVTTRIIASLVTDSYNLHFPLLQRGGHIQGIIYNSQVSSVQNNTLVGCLLGIILPNERLHPKGKQLKIYNPSRKLTWIMDTQNDGLEKLTPFKHCHFLVFTLDFWGVPSQKWSNVHKKNEPFQEERRKSSNHYVSQHMLVFW